MKKRVLAVIMMAVMLMASVMGVSAAGSVVATPSVSTTQKPTTENQNKGYIIRTDENQFKVDDDTTKDSEVKAVAIAYNKDADMNKLFESTPINTQAQEEARDASKAAVAGMVPLTKIFDLHDVNGGLPTEDEKHVVKLNIPGLTEEHTKVVALHFSNQRNIWEVIQNEEGQEKKVDVDHKNDIVTVTFDDLSPVMILANKGLTTDTDQKLPQTAGTSSAWMLWTAMALIVVGAGVVVSQKKSR